eukprot:scaffold3190_cov409-Prasinococcus_capsulatus_cf.AAC.25
MYRQDSRAGTSEWRRSSPAGYLNVLGMGMYAQNLSTLLIFVHTCRRVVYGRHRPRLLDPRVPTVTRVHDVQLTCLRWSTIFIGPKPAQRDLSLKGFQPLTSGGHCQGASSILVTMPLRVCRLSHVAA